MAMTPPTVAPVAPIAPPVAPPPPPAPPPLSTLNEKASQLAGKISSQPEFEQALASVGGQTLTTQDKGKLWDTVNQTRVGQGLPALTVQAPGAPPGGAPLVGGSAPVSPAVQGALPSSVTGQPPAPKPQAPAAPQGLKQVPGQNVPLEQAPPAPTAQYQAPDLKTAEYKAPTYEPPKKGLEYAAAALSLLFPGAPIGRAAAGFAQGLTQGADKKYARAQQTAQDQYKSEAAKDATLNQGALTKASQDVRTAEAYDKYVATKTAVGNENQDRIYNARQQARAQGTNPDTGKPFQLPPTLTNPPPPTSGYDGLARWHQARQQAYLAMGATAPAAAESEAAKEATRQATDAANNARQLFEAAQRAKVEIGIHNDTEANGNSRHNDTVWHEDQRALLADAGRRAEYGVKASAADKSLFTTWQQYTKPQTKTVEIKDVNGAVTGIHTVPMVGEDGKTPVPPPINDAHGFQTRLTQTVNLIRKDRDPEGAAAYYSAHMGNDAAGLAAQEILQQAGQATVLRMMANGNVPQPRNWPEVTEPSAPPVPQAAPVAPQPPVPPHSYSHRGDDKLQALGAAITGPLAPDARHRAAAAAHPPASAAPPAATGAPDAAGHVPGQVYEDANGRRALYNGNGSWTPQ